MAFEKRKIYIEFLGRDVVNLVTPFRNKTFQLKKACTIDLISFKVSTEIYEEISGFFATFEYNHETKHYSCSVHMRISEDSIDEIGDCDINNNKKIYTGAVWVEK